MRRLGRGATAAKPEASPRAALLALLPALPPGVPAALDRAGRPLAPTPLDAVTRLYHEDEASTAAAIDAWLASDTSSTDVSFRVVYADGALRDREALLTRGAPRSGLPPFVVVVRDATERAERERQQRDSVRRTRRGIGQLLEAISDGLAIFDPEARVLYLNAKAEAMLGLRRAGVVGWAVEEVLPAAFGARLAHGARAAQASGAEQRFEEQIESTGRWLDVRLYPGPGRVSALLTDVTDRRLIEQRLLHSERRFRALVERSHEVVQLYSRDGRMLYVSPSVERILGYPADAFLPMDHRALVHPDDLAQTDAAFAAMLARPGAVVQTVARIRDAEGRWRWFEATGANLLDDSAVEAVVVNFRDMTEQREAETALRASRDQLQAIVQSVADGIIVQDPSGRLLFANETAARMIGLPASGDLAGQAAVDPLRSWVVLDEKGRPFGAARLPGRQALRTRRPHEALLRYRATDSDEERWSHVHAVPVLDADGSVRFAVTALQDVTQLKRAEAALRYLSDAGTALSRTLDLDSTLAELARLVVGALAGYCAIDLVEEEGGVRRALAVHADPARQPLLDALAPIWHPTRQPDAILQRVIESGETVLLPEVTAEMIAASAPSPDVAAIFTALEPREYLVSPLVARGRVIGTLTVVRTAGERRLQPDEIAMAEELAARAALAIDNARLYAEAQAALSEARAALEMRTRFLSIASHELRTPLTALRGQVDLSRRRLARLDVDPRIGEGLQVAARQVQRLNRLVDELLDVSRLAGGRFAIDPASADVVEVARLAVEAARAGDPDHPIDLLAPEQPVEAEIDAARIEQVFLNLLQNAGKYSPAGAPIVLRVAQTDDAVTVSVQDRGIGVPEAERERIFEPFHRANNVDRGVTGLGLGLHIAREIVRAHGGDLTLVSAQGEGSTFTVTLPRTPAPADSQ